MSIAGRNRIHGAVVSFYRAERTGADTGGGVRTRWRALTGRENVRLELLPSTDKQLRDAFGTEPVADLMALVEPRATATDPMPGDGLVVTTGHYAGNRFFVTVADPLGKATQVALVQTSEVFP